MLPQNHLHLTHLWYTVYPMDYPEDFDCFTLNGLDISHCIYYLSPSTSHTKPRSRSCTCTLVTTQRWPRFCTPLTSSMELPRLTAVWSYLSCSNRKACRWMPIWYPFYFVATLALLAGEDLVQKHNRHCLPPGTSWVYRALSSWTIQRCFMNWPHLILNVLQDNHETHFNFKIKF